MVGKKEMEWMEGKTRAGSEELVFTLPWTSVLLALKFVSWSVFFCLFLSRLNDWISPLMCGSVKEGRLETEFQTDTLPSAAKPSCLLGHRGIGLLWLIYTLHLLFTEKILLRIVSSSDEVKQAIQFFKAG